MKSLVWLASYPKSGNTWLRIFLTNYLLSQPTPQDINHLPLIPHASAPYLFDEIGGISSSNLTAAEIGRLRPAIFRQYAEFHNSLKFLKCHDAYVRLPSGKPLYPPEASAAAIYIVRNPLDLAVSYAYHEETSFDQIIRRMNTPEYTRASSPAGLRLQFEQKLSSWSGHVRSWLEAASIIRLHVVRYEDMLDHTIDTFTEMIRFLKLDDDPERIRRAVAFSSFQEVRQQEEPSSFQEQKAEKSLFFRSGKAGSAHAELIPAQIEQIISAHGEVMRQFGYLPEITE